MPDPETTSAIQRLAQTMGWNDNTVALMFQIAALAEQGDPQAVQEVRNWGIPVNYHGWSAQPPAPTQPQAPPTPQGPEGVEYITMPDGTVIPYVPGTFGRPSQFGPAAKPPGPQAPQAPYYGAPTWAETETAKRGEETLDIALARLQMDLVKLQQQLGKPQAPVAPYYGAATERESAQTAIEQAKYNLEVAKFLADPQNQQPLRSTTNPENPNEEKQRREWMRIRASRGEDPNDYGAFAAHQAAVGAPSPSFEGFMQNVDYEREYQTRQDLLHDAETNYQRQLGLISAGQALTPYQAGQLQTDWARIGQTQQGLALGAARTGEPLSYLSYLSGTVPGAGGGVGTDIYQGFPRLVPPTPLTPGGGVGAGAGGYTSEQMARVRRGLSLAGWPGANTSSDQEAVAAYLKTAVPDEFSRSLQAAGGGAPPMPPFLSAIQSGQPLAPFSLPGFRLPGIQAQNALSPYQMSAYKEASEFAGLSWPDVESAMARTRSSIGPGPFPGPYLPSPVAR